MELLPGAGGGGCPDLALQASFWSGPLSIRGWDPGGTGSALGCVRKWPGRLALSPAVEEPQSREWKLWFKTRNQVHFGTVHRLQVKAKVRSEGQSSGTKKSLAYTLTHTLTCAHTHARRRARAHPHTRTPTHLSPASLTAVAHPVLSAWKPSTPFPASLWSLPRRPLPLAYWAGDSEPLPLLSVRTCDDCLSASVPTTAPSAPQTRTCLTSLHPPWPGAGTWDGCGMKG